MNMNNQLSSNLKQLRFQLPAQLLKPLAKAINELVEMYPFEEEKKEDTNE